MPDVVQEASESQRFAEAGDIRILLVFEEVIKHHARNVHDSNRVQVARVSGTGKNVFRKTKLLDVSQTLEKRMLDNLNLRIVNGDGAVNGISDFQVSSLLLELRSVSFQPLCDLSGLVHGLSVDVETWHSTSTGILNELLFLRSIFVDINQSYLAFQFVFLDGGENNLAVRAARKIK